MTTAIYSHVIGPFLIDEAFEIVNILFEENYLAVSCVEKKNEWHVEVLSSEKITNDDIKKNLDGYTYKILKSDQLSDINWLEKCFENFKPITVGNFYLFGPHLRMKPIPKDKISIEIAAATAFGTGEHPTTNRCLLASQTFFDPKLHKSVLDIGCGSGILAIALAKLGAQNVIACDNDPEAVKISLENAAINSVSHRLQVFQNYACEFSIKKYDFVVANILLEPLMSMAEKISNSLNPEGMLVISGFQSSDDIMIIKKYIAAVGLSMIHKYDLQGWSAIVFQKCAFNLCALSDVKKTEKVFKKMDFLKKDVGCE